MGLFSGVVYNFNNGTTSSAYWIGANLLMAPTWTWTTNNTALYTNWAPDEPVDPSSFECGSVRENTYLWKKELCYAARPFVCTVNPNNAPATQPPSDSPCDPGYTLYEKQCFKLFNGFTDRVNFYDSSMFCRVNNATLPKISSDGMQDFLHSLIFDEGSNIWLGLTCWGTDPIKYCIWWDSTHPTYTNFVPGSPTMPNPIAMDVDNGGRWFNEYDFLAYMSVVVCQKPARKV